MDGEHLLPVLLRGDQFCAVCSLRSERVGAFSQANRSERKRASKWTLPCKRRTSRFRPMRSCIGRLLKNVKPSARKRGCRFVKAIQERSKTWAWINGFGATRKIKARQKRQTRR